MAESEGEDAPTDDLGEAPEGAFADIVGDIPNSADQPGAAVPFAADLVQVTPIVSVAQRALFNAGQVTPIVSAAQRALFDTGRIGTIFADIAADPSFASIIAANYADASALVTQPQELADDLSQRDFLEALRLALRTAQSGGRTGLQALTRVAKSRPTQATAVLLAVGLVYLLMQLHPDFKEIVGDLANAIELVLFVGVTGGILLGSKRQ